MAKSMTADTCRRNKRPAWHGCRSAQTSGCRGRPASHQCNGPCRATENFASLSFCLAPPKKPNDSPAACWPPISSPHPGRVLPVIAAIRATSSAIATSGANACLQGNFVQRRVGDIAFEVDAQRGPLGAGSRQPENDARSVVEQDPDALLRAARSVDRIDVAEIVGGFDAQGRRSPFRRASAAFAAAAQTTSRPCRSQSPRSRAENKRCGRNDASARGRSARPIRCARRGY